MASTSDNVPFQELLEQQKEMARDQLAAAWQIHVDQVEEQLHKGWKENLANLFDERFRLLTEGLEEEFQKRLSVKQAEVRAQALADAESQRREAKRELSASLGQTVRRIAQAEDAAAWVTGVLDGLQGLTQAAAFFSVVSGKLRCEGARPQAVTLELDIAQAPAFANVQETMDTVVAAATPGELSEAVHGALELEGREQVYLLPIAAGPERQLAGIVLVAPERDEFDLSLVETLCITGGALRKAPPPKAGVVTGIAAAPPRARDEEGLTVRAQRFARVKVAELRLYRSDAVNQGRAHKKLYSMLKEEIDKARAQYKEEFLGKPGFADYLHEELVRTLANGETELMGADYPGALQ